MGTLAFDPVAFKAPAFVGIGGGVHGGGAPPPEDSEPQLPLRAMPFPEAESGRPRCVGWERLDYGEWAQPEREQLKSIAPGGSPSGAAEGRLRVPQSRFHGDLIP